MRDEPPVSQLDGDEFVKNIHFDEKEGRYEVRLPWKEGQFPASNEYELCVTRLRQLHSRLNKKQGAVKRLRQRDQRSSQFRDNRSRTRK